MESGPVQTAFKSIRSSWTHRKIMQTFGLGWGHQIRFLFLICPATACLTLFLLTPEFPTFPHLTKSKSPMPIQSDKSRNTRIRLSLTCPNPFPHDKHEQELLGKGGRIFLNPTESRLLCKYKHHSLSY